MYYLLIFVVISADQIIKAYIHGSMAFGESIPIVYEIFHITYVRNTGAAFSILQGQSLLLKVLPILFITAIVVFMRLKGKDQHWSLNTSLSLIVAGGAGNLIDRIRLGYVIDFFDFRIFPVFNVADIAVCTGCALMIIYILVFDKSGEENKA